MRDFMNRSIIQINLTTEMRKEIFEQFAQHAKQQIGFNGLEDEPIAFCLQINGKNIGTCGIQLFWGQLHIKYLVVDEKYRGQGIGSKLLNHALNYGAKHECTFAFVETMSFQAPEFYQNHGFEIELKRDGYAHNQSFYYLKKIL